MSALVIIFCFKYYFDDDDDSALEQLPADVHVTISSGFEPNDEFGSGASSNKLLPRSMSTESTHLLGPRNEGNLGFAIFICNLTYFVHFYGFAVQETITTYVSSVKRFDSQNETITDKNKLNL